MNQFDILQAIYRHFTGLAVSGVIPVAMLAPALVGTVQDDPFDVWVGSEIKKALPQLEVFHAGKLTTPDLVIRDRTSGVVIGLEVKKLIQAPNGSDSRGLTMDYNSCLPCGKTIVKVGNDDVVIPNFYLFCLLNGASTGIVTLILMDGDFINYDLDIHKESKISNYTEYGHGPYGEGSYRNRRMYTYPNPLNYKLTCFHLQHSFVIKKHDAIVQKIDNTARLEIQRDDIHGNSFKYLIVDCVPTSIPATIPTITGIFDACKAREAKVRTPSKVKLTII